jgi:transcriptional regulator with XRE-family HTH domain
MLKNVNMHIGERIKELRKTKGIRQKELAVKLKTRQSTVSAWEIGRNEPNPAQRRKLCEIFNINEAELFGGLPSKINPEILEALQDPIAVKALLITYKNTQDIKNTIKALLETIPTLSLEKRQAILALCK